MSYADLTIVDTTLLAGVRDHLAITFGEKIAVVVPDISEFIEFEAEATRNPTDKQCYLRAAHILYTRRNYLAQEIAKEFCARFDDKLNPSKRIANRTTRLSLDALALVHDDQMEEDIAVSACGNRLKEQSEYELFTLTCRIAALVGKERLDDQESPVYPRVFARALMKVLGEIDATLQIKLTIFKAFGPILLDIVPDTLTSANGWLASRGIDLEVEGPYGQPVVTSEHPFLPGPAPVSAGASSEMNILANLFQKALGAESFVPNQAAAAASPAHKAREGCTTGSTTGNYVRPSNKYIQVQAQPQSQTQTDSPNVFEDDKAVVANVVNVMFDQLFMEPRIPAVLKEIVARLKTPVLQVAQADRTVFSNPNHPARKLIDLIAEFGMTLDLDQGDESTIDSVSRVVEEVVRRHATDGAAFRVAYNRLDDMFYHHEESALQADPDIRALQETEALECAHQAATAMVYARLRGRVLPVAVQAFIQIAWRDVLIRDYLDGGLNGKSWKLGVATLDALLKSVEPAVTRESRQNLAKSLHSLIELIRDGTEHAEVHPHLVDEFFVDLERLHEMAVQGEAALDVAVIEADAAGEHGAALEGISSASPSARLAEMGLACGAWLEMRDNVVAQRWRLCWVTPHKGTCVLKNYESRGRRIISVDELRDGILVGSATVAQNVGITDAVLAEAFRVVARKAQPNYRQ